MDLYLTRVLYHIIVFLVSTFYLQCVQKKVSPPNILHWQVQTCPVLNKIKRALGQKYLSYCRQISYDNRFSIFTNCCHSFQLPTWLVRRTSLLWRYFVDTQNVSKEDIVLIKVLRVEKGYGAKRIMTKFPGRNFSLASVKSGWLRGRGILQKRVYRCRIHDVDHLKERLIAEWRRFDQNIIDSCRPVAGATAWVCQRERRTLWASNINDQTI